jgi:hypothetical protein
MQEKSSLYPLAFVKQPLPMPSSAAAISHPIFLNFPSHRHREFRHEFPMARRFEVSQMTFSAELEWGHFKRVLTCFCPASIDF